MEQAAPSAVLDAALTWTHGTLQPARVADLDAVTPCAGWRLRDLLVHLEDSLAALGEAAGPGPVDLGQVDLRPVGAGGRHLAPPVADRGHPEVLVDRVCRRACATRAAWSARTTSAPVGIGGRAGGGRPVGAEPGLRLDRDVLVGVAALEVAVHGWDVARAVGSDWQLPADLAVRLLPVALAHVGAEDRAQRFGPPLPAPARSGAADRLLAHLGRDPRWSRDPDRPGVSAVAQASVAT